MGKSGRRKRTIKMPRVLGGKRPHYNAGNAQYATTVYGTCPLCRFEGPSHSPQENEAKESSDNPHHLYDAAYKRPLSLRLLCRV